MNGSDFDVYYSTLADQLFNAFLAIRLSLTYGPPKETVPKNEKCTLSSITSQ